MLLYGRSQNLLEGLEVMEILVQLRYGDKLLAISSDTRAIEVSITKPIFYDLKGERQRVE